MSPALRPDQAEYLNTPRLVANDQQQTVWKWDQQEPFGANACNPDPDGDNVEFEFNLRFPGQYFDRETNQHYNYFRDYEPALGRYVQSDPIGLKGGLNTYAYVKADPLRRSDRLGLRSCFDIRHCYAQAGANLRNCNSSAQTSGRCALAYSKCALAATRGPLALTLCLTIASAQCAEAVAEGPVVCGNQLLADQKNCDNGLPIAGYQPTENYWLQSDDCGKCYSEPDYRRTGN